MSIRVWISPPVQEEVAGITVWTSKARRYCTGGLVNRFPSNDDGSPASSWVITIGRASDWTAADADSELIDLFAGDLPSEINSPGDLRSYLRTRTVADVPLARRNTITSNLDALGVPRADFMGSTPLWKVFQRVASTLLEKDANFGSRFNF